MLSSTDAHGCGGGGIIVCAPVIR